MKVEQRSSHSLPLSESELPQRPYGAFREAALSVAPRAESISLPFAAAQIDHVSIEEREFERKQNERKQSIEREGTRRAQWGGLVGFTEDVARIVGKIDRSINSFVFKLTATWVAVDLAFLGSINSVFSTIFGVSLWVWPLGVGWIVLGILGVLIFAAGAPGGRGWH